jgi:acyl-CoA thioesterase FadM
MKVGSRVPLLDCDYNLHKSNSTYFADFDVARMHLLTCLVVSGMVKTGTELGQGARVGLMLGAVNCNFRREIKPGEGFEMWSRILTWDRKWLYTITHFVKKGSVKPKGWTLQPWRKVRQGRKNMRTGEEMTAQEVATLEKTATAETEAKLGNGATSPSTTPAHPAIFASAIAKYVFKHKRLTIPPERILRASNLLPPEDVTVPPPPPLEHRSSSSSNVDDPSSIANNTTLLAIPGATGTVMAASAGRDANTSVNKNTNIADSWTWTRIEAERQRGLRIAGHLANLEELNGEFNYDGNLALGEYTDLF